MSTDPRVVELQKQRRRGERHMMRGGVQLLLTGAGVLLAKLVLVLVETPPGVLMLVITLALGLSAIVGMVRILVGNGQRKLAMRRLRALEVSERPPAVD